MIDFRYHIISIIAIFLALGLGILLGSSVVSGTLVERLRADSNRARAARDVAQDKADTFKKELDGTQKTLEDQVSPYVVNKRLADRSVVFVSEQGTLSWANKVRDAAVQAGATSVGNLILTEKWKLSEQGAVEELVNVIIEPLVPAFDPGTDPASAALGLLGARLSDPVGQQLLDGLVKGGFVVAEGRKSGQPWPGNNAAFVIYGSGHAEKAKEPTWFAALAQATAQNSPTLVVSGKPEDYSTVTLLRESQQLPAKLSTFDAAAGPVGGVEIGVVAALEAAIDARGGHFGTAPDRRFVPQPV